MGPLVSIERTQLVVQGDTRHLAFPCIACLGDGILVLTYREGSDHFTSDGVVRVVRSHDGGETWSPPETIFSDPAWDCRNHHGMSLLADGTLVVTAMKYLPVAPPATLHLADRDIPNWGGHNYRRRPHFLISRDKGVTWQAREVALEALSAEPDQGCLWGRAQPLADGRILFALHGTLAEGTAAWRSSSWFTGVIVAGSMGAEWHGPNLIAFDPVAGKKFNETDILRLKSGCYLAIIREETSPYLFHTAWSDDGLHWGAYEDTDVSGQSPSLLLLEDGTVLCAYRDMRPGHLGVSLSQTRDEGRTWEFLGQVYSAPSGSRNWDCAYPSTVDLSNGRILCAYYTSFVGGASSIRLDVLKLKQ